MVALTDIAPQVREVHGIDVYGVSSAGIAALIGRFPELGQMAIGKGKLTASDMLEKGPNIVAAIIAAGCGSVADFDAEIIASRLPVETQFNLLNVIGEMTFPGGASPFVERLKEWAEAVLGVVLKVQDTKSPNPSPRSQEPDSRLENAGS